MIEREAGPALDAKVANVAFGRAVAFWRSLEDSPTSGEPRWERCTHDTPGAFVVDGDPWGEWQPGKWTMIPPFSTEGSAMLYLIERMRVLGYPFIVVPVANTTTLAVSFGAVVIGEELPHAVALAAVAALTEEGR